ncbi:hypothetical protein J1N10_10380 [Carboxylicivirga sp. A043]|uniref:hypothetical protein n=1 Tax=Carboxylicivirga litoralis TaxID=2816963 RepID=UPI0021CB2E71|nr:hypothetical protein [Carboxylicivirga sp. A043]MCU4156387.1 hypothetical protein [Carboxylicivirga sp. A043]
MAKIKLEFEKLTIHRPKERWKLYFIIVAEHPTEEDKMVITSLPQSDIIRLKPSQGNVINFEPKGDNVDGLFVIERDMPADRRVSVRVYLRHTRKSVRDTGELLSEIQKELGSDAVGIVTDVLGITGAPWLVVSKYALGALGKVLRQVKDKDFGFVSMDEEFGDEFENQTELDRENTFSTGEASIVWSWSVD